MTSAATTTNKPLLLSLLKPLLLLLPISFLLILPFLSITKPTSNPNPNPNSNPSNFQYLDIDFSTTTADSTPGIRIRRNYRSYRDYITHQLNKTLNPQLRRIWTTRDWDRKIAVFSAFFRRLQSDGLLRNSSAAICLGARTGQEVAALRHVGVVAALGLDLVPAPPLVVAGDFHRQPFPDESFDFEFSNVFDHALFPRRFAAEVERTLRPGGVCVLHLTVRRKGDKYSANDLVGGGGGGVDGVVRLFTESELVRVREVDGFGLDTEIVLRKNKKT